VDADLDTLATALYVTIDDLLSAAPELAPWRPAVGIPLKVMWLCGVCGTDADNRVVPTDGGATQLALCRPCTREIVGQAANGARKGCHGSRSVLEAFVRQSDLEGGGMEVVLPERVCHGKRCRRVAAQLQFVGREMRPRWDQRRGWLVEAARRREVQPAPDGMPPLLFAYRDHRLVCKVELVPTVSGDVRLALPAVAMLAAGLQATQLQLILDAWIRTNLDGQPPPGPLANDSRASSALVAYEWDVSTGNAHLDGLLYGIGDDGRPIVDWVAQPFPADGAVAGRIPDLLEAAIRQRQVVPALRYARWLASLGHDVEVYPLAADTGRPAAGEDRHERETGRFDPPDLPFTEL
jgi:hypothetical protein